MSNRVEAERRFPLRAAGLAATAAGALATVGLTLWVGRGGSSLVLMVLFVGWVLGPFAGLLVADRMSGPWSRLTTTTLYILMLVVTVASMAAYGAVAVQQPAQPAFMFLVVPLCSWVVMVITTGAAAFVSRGRS